MLVLPHLFLHQKRVRNGQRGAIAKVLNFRFLIMYLALLGVTACSDNDDLPVSNTVTTVSVSNNGRVVINGSNLPSQITVSAVENILGKPTRIISKKQIPRSIYVWDNVGISLISFGSGETQLRLLTSNKFDLDDVDSWPRSVIKGVVQLPGGVSVVSPAELGSFDEVDALEKTYRSWSGELGRDTDAWVKNNVYFNQFGHTNISVALEGVGRALRVPFLIIR